MAGITQPENISKMMNYAGAIPGQSLTNSPDNKYAWENPPQMVNRREAELYILEELTDKDTFNALMDMLLDGLPIETIARTYLMSGYSRGLWNVDLMLLLAESVGFIIMALAEKAGVEYELYQGEKDEERQEPEDQVKSLETVFDTVKQGISKAKPSKPLSRELSSKVEEINVESLLSPDMQEEEKINE